MATGDFTLFQEFSELVADGTHDLDVASDYKIALITSAQAPAAGDTTAVTWPGTYTEVAGTGGYTTGGEVLVQTWAQTSGTAKFDAPDITWTQNGSSPANAVYAVIYKDSTTDYLVGWFDLGGTIDLSAGDFTIAFHGSGIFTIGP